MSITADSPFKPVARRRAFEDVIVQVEAAIAEGRLGPGDRLPPERELAAQLQVSRASVRDALRVL
ncbi:MAG: FadR family transcriptional regulator [Thermoleophilia bacterium]|nr:FadR family transcriptional regulator [Thermoleophilia bacterium]